MIGAKSLAGAKPTAKDWDRQGLLVVAFAHGASDFYSGMIPLVVFFVATHNGLSPIFQGFVGFVWYATSSIVQPFFGAYSDRHGRWWFLPLAIVLTATGISLAGLVSDPRALVALVCVAGLGSAILHPEGGRFAAMLSGSHKASGLSIFTVGGQVGFALGPMLAAVALAHFGPGGTAWLMIPGVIASAGLFAAMRRVGPRAMRRHQSAPAAAPAPTDRVGIVLMVSSTALRQLTLSAFTIFLPNLLVSRGFSFVEAGQIVTMFLLVTVVGTYAGGSLGDRFGKLSVSIVSALAAVPTLLGFFFVSGPLALAVLALGSVMLSASNAPGVALVQEMLPRNLGMALGLMNGVAFGVGSALVTGVGAIVAAGGPRNALVGVACVPIASAAAYAAVGLRKESKWLKKRP